MLRERYEPMNIFELVPALSMQMEPVLTKLDQLLEDDTLFQLLKADLARRHPRTLIDGRPSTPVEVILRMLIVKHLYGFSYEQTEHWVGDSLVLRQFCRLYLERVPDDTTLIRWANTIQPQTLHALLDHIVELARTLKVTRGRKLRVDSTVVETNIHHPSDSTLLHDSVRVLGRTLGKAKRLLSAVSEGADLTSQLFRNRTRSAKRQMKRIMQTARQHGEAAADQMITAYRRLLDVAQAGVRQAKQVGAALGELGEQADCAGQRLAEQLQQLVSLVEQVISQTERRVLNGEKVPSDQKVLSIFEPHTAVIRKGKPGRPVEFGRVVWLNEVEGGIISNYAVLRGNPKDHEQVQPTLAKHRNRKLFEQPPQLLAGDRGAHSAANEAYAKGVGVKHVALPKPGARSAKRVAYEQQEWFRRGHNHNWRAGIEGRISGLKRRHKLARCLNHGEAGMERWVGWGLIAHDLHQIALAVAC